MSGDDDKMIMMSSEGYKNIVNSEDGQNLFWTTDKDTELPIRMTKSGLGSIAPRTICSVFEETT